MPTKQSLLSVIKDFLSKLYILLEEVIKRNYEERIKALEWDVSVQKGNNEELLKRVTAMEKYLKIEYETKAKYIKK